MTMQGGGWSSGRRTVCAIAAAAIVTAAFLCGCIVVPEGRLVDGSLAPAKRIEEYASQGRIAVGKSKADDVARALLSPDFGGRPSQWTPALFENGSRKQLAVVYEERCRAYGVTLNQHFFYLPMPMFGANWDPRKVAVFLSHDERGTLTRWRCVTEPNLEGFAYRPTVRGTGAK
jgi:hypothetical protein